MDALAIMERGGEASQVLLLGKVHRKLIGWKQEWVP